MKYLLSSIMILFSISVYGQKSIVDVQPEPVVIKTSQQKAANSFKVAAGMLLVSGIIGVVSEVVSNPNSQNTPQISPSNLRNLRFARHATLGIAGISLLSGAIELSSAPPNQEFSPQ